MFPRAFTLGRIAAIPVRLHWSWLIIFGLLVATLRPVYALHYCVGAQPCGPDLALAALMAGLVGLSVLLHELGHAIVARRMLVPVQSITLFAFGGVAEVEAESPGPGAELAIALAGPAMNLLLAGAGALLWLAGAEVWATLGAHLALANLVMALFNLLPGYPMDGGRVLRATLWFFSDDLLPATRDAAQVGRACGALFGLAGPALAIFAQQPVAALWSALVGLFLYRTASGSYRQLLLQSVLRGVSVGDLMQRRLRTLSRELSVEQFVARYVLGQAETAFAVVGPPSGPDADPPLLGMMYLRHIRRLKTSEWAAHQVGELMTPAEQVATLPPELPAYDALFVLNGHPDGLLPVTEEGHLVGMLRRRDLAVFIQVQLARRAR